MKIWKNGKRRAVLCGLAGGCAALGLIGGVPSVRSQSVGGRKTVLEQLQEMRETNRKLIERQGETLKKLEDVEKQASQLKFMTKRG